MKFIKIHWTHSFKDSPEFIYSAIDEEGYEIKKVEVFKSGDYTVYSENINSDRLAEGIYPSLEELTFEEKIESMQAFEIDEVEFNEIWSKYLTLITLENIDRLVNSVLADAEIIDISYSNNDMLKLKIRDYKENYLEFYFNNIFKLYFEDYLNNDISHINKEVSEEVCTINIFSASTDKKILEFSFFLT
ncbi:MAG: hypothetical protein FWE63_05235 [Bacteroidales bacterium]|nr:hypothetical protein [Bacteroidales bacterium]